MFSEAIGFSVKSCLPLLAAATFNSDLLAQLCFTIGFGIVQM